MAKSASNDKTLASTKAIQILNQFSTIAAGDKLTFHKTTFEFEINRGGGNKSRTFANLFRASGTENSVKNEEMFYKPIVLVFNVARYSSEKGVQQSAYNGLCNLRQTYQGDTVKLEALEKTLTAVNTLIQEPINLSAESLRNISTALAESPAAIFRGYAALSEILPSATIQQINAPDRVALQVIFSAVRTDKTKLNESLKTISNQLAFFSDRVVSHASAEESLDVHYISKLIYNILQSVEDAHIQRHSNFENWRQKIIKAADKNFTTYFQEAKKVKLDSSYESLPDADFLWFNGDRQIDHSNVSRLYFFPSSMSNIDRFIQVAGQILKSSQFRFIFKIDFNKSLVFHRRDAIVLYYVGDITAGRKLAEQFITMLGHGYLKPNFGPFGSTSVSPTNDVYWQDEPGRFDTGMSNKEQLSLENRNQVERQHSASSIRAELIAMALLNWKINFDYQVAKCKESGLDNPDLNNPDIYEFEFEMFQAAVARALDGYKYLLSPKLNV